MAVQAVTELLSELERALETVAEPRHRAVIEVCEDLGSCRKTSDATGLSKPRVRVGLLVRVASRAPLWAACGD